jgi:hypothetical protein
MERTLAEAHACVLELGVPVSSGVDVDYTVPVAPQLALRVNQDGGAASAPHEPQAPKQPGTLIEALRGPREWLTRRRSEANSIDPSDNSQEPGHSNARPPQSEQPVAASNGNLAEEGENDSDDGAIWSRQPTQLFVQRTSELPPYQAHATAQALPATYDDPDEELQFDGWEDTPPALDNPRFNAAPNVVYKPRLLGDSEDVDNLGSVYLRGYEVPVETTAAQPNMHIVDDETEAPRASARTIAGDLGKRGLSLAGNTLRAMLPDKIAGRVPGVAAGGGGKTQLPLRLVIVGVLAVVGAILVFSLISMKGNPQRTAAHTLLTDAQALETSANQTGVADADRLEQLQLALDKARQAAVDDPTSQEATTLITKLNGEIDTARGITRLSSLNLLFDLDAIDQAANPISQTTGVGAAANPAQAPASEKLQIVGQGNDLYALDQSANRIYRCQIAAKACSPLLNKGENVDGTTVGDLLAITLRVGSPVVLDTQFVAYVYNADSGSWNAQQLGSADSLQQPVGIATYDGNLYLLGAKPGQISKYVSGQYGESPTDWITDDATKAAMQSPVAIAIDGAIYVTLADGKILVMQGGKLTTTITPKSSQGMSDPTLLYTGTDVQNLYLLRSDGGTVTRMNKDGKTLSILQTPTDSEVTSVSGLSVDEGKNKLYLAQGRKVYEAAIPAQGASTPAQSQSQTQQSTSQTPQPTVRPTVEP